VSSSANRTASTEVWIGPSRNTVKAHAIAIYRKLECSRRSDAVARARELGLLRT